MPAKTAFSNLVDHPTVVRYRPHGGIPIVPANGTSGARCSECNAHGGFQFWWEYGPLDGSLHRIWSCDIGLRFCLSRPGMAIEFCHQRGGAAGTDSGVASVRDPGGE